MMNTPSANKGAPGKVGHALRVENAVIGIVGLGTMGASIAACLLAAGHRVVAIEIDEELRDAAPERVLHYLTEFDERAGLSKAPSQFVANLEISYCYESLEVCSLVIESVIEDLQAKQKVIRTIERFVGTDALIGSNTSALPITLLQEGAAYPGRVLGMHWSLRPASPFLELIRGDNTSQGTLERATELALFWGKDPALVKVDVRGFIANRIAYAMYREALHLVEIGAATAEDIDRSVKYTIGDWLPKGSVFGFAEYNLPLSMAIMKDLFPDLCNSAEVPAILEALQRDGGNTLCGYSPQATPADSNGDALPPAHSELPVSFRQPDVVRIEELV